MKRILAGILLVVFVFVFSGCATTGGTITGAVTVIPSCTKEAVNSKNPVSNTVLILLTTPFVLLWGATKGFLAGLTVDYKIVAREPFTDWEKDAIKKDIFDPCAYH